MSMPNTIRVLAGVMISRTEYLSIKIEEDLNRHLDGETTVSYVAIGHAEIYKEKISTENGRIELQRVIGRLYQDDRYPDVICIGTYGAQVDRREDPYNEQINGISESVSGRLNGLELRDFVRKTSQKAMAGNNRALKEPHITIETDVGVYALGENYIRSIKLLNNDPLLLRGDPLAFGFFSGGVGAAISKNVTLNRGLAVGQRGKMPVNQHPTDIEVGFQYDKHPYPFTLESMACIEAIEERAKIVDKDQLPRMDMNFDELAAFSHETGTNLKTWDIVAHYIAMFCFAMTVNFSPRLIVLCGRTIDEKIDMLQRVRDCFSRAISGIALEKDSNLLQSLPEIKSLETYIQPSFSIETCLFGCLEVAKKCAVRKATQ